MIVMNESQAREYEKFCRGPQMTNHYAEDLARALRQLLNSIPQNGSVWPTAIMEAQCALARYDVVRKS